MLRRKQDRNEHKKSYAGGRETLQNGVNSAINKGKPGKYYRNILEHMCILVWCYLLNRWKSGNGIESNGIEL